MITITPALTGRIVGGHPMDFRQQYEKDGTTKKLQRDKITPSCQTYIGLAIPKTPGLDWKQEPWGAQIVQAATADWPNGEHGATTFAWKVTDGDSAVPNKKGKKPCDREGYPGHWVLALATGLGTVKCFHAGRYLPEQQIQDKNEIKAGDYCRVQVTCKGNGPTESPGVYLNPDIFELSRAGVRIETGDGPDATEVFGGSAAVLPAGAQVDSSVAAPAPTPSTEVAQAPDFLNGPAPAPPTSAAPAPPAPVEVRRVHAGKVYTEAALLANGWNGAQVAALPLDPLP